MWSTATGMPTRLWGFSVPAPNDDEGPRKLASAVVERHLALLAPGATMGDFTLDVDHVQRAAGGLRTIGFLQHYKGMQVLGGHVALSFKNGRLFGIGSSALPDIDAQVPVQIIAPEAASAAAMAWVSEGASATRAGEVSGPYVLPFEARGKVSYAVVLQVRVEARHPTGSFDVFVDAATGEPIARKQRLMFETVQIELEAWERSPSFGERLIYPADRVPLEIGGSQATGESAPDGTFSFEGESVSGTAGLYGSRVEVTNLDGEEATLDFEASAGDTILWSEQSDELDAQIVTFVHGGLVNAYAKNFAPDLPFLDSPVRASVNDDDVCNAYSDGSRITFFAAGSGCENTGRIADVVYHEYGHSIHANTYLFCTPQPNCIPDGALSEGIADYLATTITGDHGMARGFFYDDSPLRDVDPAGGERVWPNDVVGQVHYDGEIIGGTLWDLRKVLIEELGEEEGVAVADRLYHGALYRADDIPTMYPEMLLVDDDDGDLDNGTPHQCAINAAFALHGLRPVDATIETPGLAPPTMDGAEVAVGFNGLAESCGESVAGAAINWWDPSNDTLLGSVSMTVGSDGLARGRIPTAYNGQTIRYNVTLDNGAGTLVFPQNAADPAYQLYVGAVTPIFCTDFETDPFAAGWTHQLVSGTDQLGADDWMWGPPNGTNVNGDPAVAFSGTNVVGQDLSPDDGEWDGLYQPQVQTALISPVVAAAGFSSVRLQYRRWLNVEDAFFDRAYILANGQIAWQNISSNRGNESNVHHQDKEWRFQDVDLTPYLDATGSVQVRFESQSDAGLELGGWTLDDLCVVGVKASTCPVGQVCEPPAPLPTDEDETPVDGAESDGTGDGCNCEVRGASRGSSASLALGVALAAAAVSRRRRR